MDVNGLTRRSDLGPESTRAGVEFKAVGWPQGFVDRQSAKRLVDALTASTRSGVSFGMALSRVYSGDQLPALPPRLSLGGADGWFIRATQADLYACSDIDWVEEMTRGHCRHFPIAIWPDDLAWSVAAPLYSDSWYFAGSTQAYSRLASYGLEIHPVPREAAVAAEGD
jgi:hypothetical protein